MLIQIKGQKSIESRIHPFFDHKGERVVYKISQFFLLLAGLLLVPLDALAASAVAADMTLHKLGYCYAKQTLEEARQCAMSNCAKSGGRRCQIIDSGIKGGNSAIAGGDGQIATVLTSHEDDEMVAARAVWDCIARVTDCDYADIQAGACKKQTKCRVLAKWREPESEGNGQAARTNPSGTHAANGLHEADRWINQGNALFKERHFSEALQAYSRAIEAYPDASPAWANRGLVYASMTPPDFAAARQNYDKALAINPKNDHAYFDRAMLNKRSGQQQAYLDDLNAAVKLGNQMAQRELQQAAARPSQAQPAATASNDRVSPANSVTVPSGGYETCSVPSNRLAMQGGIEKPVDPAYAAVCMVVLPPSCRNWTVDRQPCAYRACMTRPGVSHCPGGEPTSYVAKQTLPFTKEDFAMMDSMIAAEAQRIAAQRGNLPTGNAGATALHFQEQLNHRMVEYGNGNAGGVTYNGR